MSLVSIRNPSWDTALLANNTHATISTTSTATYGPGVDQIEQLVLFFTTSSAKANKQ